MKIGIVGVFSSKGKPFHLSCNYTDILFGTPGIFVKTTKKEEKVKNSLAKRPFYSIIQSRTDDNSPQESGERRNVSSAQFGRKLRAPGRWSPRRKKKRGK